MLKMASISHRNSLLLSLILSLILNQIGAQKSETVPFPNQSDSCNVVQVNCGGGQSAPEPMQESNRSPGPPGKRGAIGSIGPKGDRGGHGFKGEKGNDVDVNELKMKVFNMLRVMDCRELHQDHGMNESGYYMMQSNDNEGPPRYRYCDFRIYIGATGCRELYEKHDINVNGYYQIASNNADEPSYIYCDFKIYKDVFTCNQLEQRDGAMESGKYIVGTLGNKYEVHCDFSNFQAFTEVWHDSTAETKITACNTKGCYSNIPQYNINQEQIMKIVNSSKRCRQFIKFRCTGSLLMRETYGWWVSRQGDKMLYWGGATRDGFCACGETGSCVDNSFKCNCDQNKGSIMTQDEGYLTDKSKLPVREIRLGDAGDANEAGWHTIGPLECSG